MTDETQEPDDPTPGPRIGRLNTLSGVRRELANLYRALRAGEVAPRVAGSGAYILTAITKSLEVELLEKRVAELEERAAGAGVLLNGQSTPGGRHAIKH